MVRAGGWPFVLRGVALDVLSAGLVSRRRSSRAAVIALCLTLSPVVAYGGRALLHATLLRSVPRANSVLKTPPDTVRLVFSEAVVPELSQIALVRRDAQKVVIDSVRLPVANDPRDVHTLIGRVGALRAGRYTVMWRVLSADGHPISGNFAFTVESGSPEIAAPTASSTVPSNSGAIDTLVAPPSVCDGRSQDGSSAGIRPPRNWIGCVHGRAWPPLLRSDCRRASQAFATACDSPPDHGRSDPSRRPHVRMAREHLAHPKPQWRFHRFCIRLDRWADRAPSCCLRSAGAAGNRARTQGNTRSHLWRSLPGSERCCRASRRNSSLPQYPRQDGAPAQRIALARRSSLAGMAFPMRRNRVPRRGQTRLIGRADHGNRDLCHRVSRDGALSEFAGRSHPFRLRSTGAGQGGRTGDSCRIRRLQQIWLAASSR